MLALIAEVRKHLQSCVKSLPLILHSGCLTKARLFLCTKTSMSLTMCGLSSSFKSLTSRKAVMLTPCAQTAGHDYEVTLSDEASNVCPSKPRLGI